MGTFLKELGTVLLGTGSVVTLFSLWWSRRLERFKADLGVSARLRQLAEERRSQVAGETLVATFRYVRALEATAESVLWAIPADTPKEARGKVEHTLRWQLLDPVEEEFRRAWISAETYLPDLAMDVLEAIWEERNEIRANQLTHISMLGQDFRDSTFLKRGFGPVPKKNLVELRTRAKKVLRPIAQLKRVRDEPEASAAGAAEQGVDLPTHHTV
jgi:hypothetical protein